MSSKGSRESVEAMFGPVSVDFGSRTTVFRLAENAVDVPTGRLLAMPGRACEEAATRLAAMNMDYTAVGVFNLQTAKSTIAYALLELMDEAREDGTLDALEVVSS